MSLMLLTFAANLRPGSDPALRRYCALGRRASDI